MRFEKAGHFVVVSMLEEPLRVERMADELRTEWIDPGLG
jgi:hypothetical protein